MKKEADLPPDFVAKCKAVTAKRARTVIDHVLRKGFITSQELKDTYGYNHPPRAIMDVKDNGIPMVMVRVEGTDGRSVGAYEFGDPEQARANKYFGRTALGKNLKATLVKRDGELCAIYLKPYPEAELQVDHRVPFQVSGDDPATDQKPENYMLLSPSANRLKSWSCEHCENFTRLKDPTIHGPEARKLYASIAVCQPLKKLELRALREFYQIEGPDYLRALLLGISH